MKNFKGVFTALITPFTNENLLDDVGMRLLIERQMQAGVNGIVFMGTTAESPTLTEEEQQRILEIAKEMCFGRTPFIIGTGTNSTTTTIEKTKRAESLGANAALIITPYYNRPTQDGIFRHFSAIAEATSIPIILYNHLGRTGQNIQIETFKRLMEIPNIVGIKECSGNITQISDFIEAARESRPQFSILTGDDPHILPVMSMGGHGVISVVSNLIPAEILAFVKALSEGNFTEAQGCHYKLMPLMRALFIETNPIPIKAALSLIALPAGQCRLPLCKLSDQNMLLLESTLKNYSLCGSTLLLPIDRK